MLSLIDNPPPWPNGARCAVSFAYDFDAESLLHLYYPTDSARRLSLASTLRYGARVAIPRLAAIWRHFGIRQTVFTPGWCVEHYPEAIELLLEGGHEIGHHGWLHERVNQLSRGDEERVLEAGIRAIEKATGAPPVGYRCPSGAFSEHTLDLLIDYGLRYDASLGGHDIPYLVERSDGRAIVELPHDASHDDWNQYVHLKDANWQVPVAAPARARETFQADFDAAWNHGGLWTAVFHPFVSGRLARAEEQVRLIEYMMEKGDVWFATCAEIAAHIDGLVARGEWTPMVERLPFWPEPPEQVALPSR
ncbi:polysaccharide deacetylase family protein [Acuticoccus mangrovi]|uniref:Chitooligosaccharide deacetylase n=1 Tax=Acuticoccus mangrovi TaxID=2796142 RepID=A0A934IMV3_9HYPH|nr:polysaccharide deacetylase [Acuticoccus mangrovi]MBJ3774294.1 polysaccharide deacetylase [Acuticoccus mangrovi]